MPSDSVALVGVGVPLSDAVASLGGVRSWEDSATVAVGPASAVAGADVLCGNRFGEFGTVVVTGADGDTSVVVTGRSATVDVTVGVVGGSGSTTDGADGMTVTEAGAWDVGADSVSRSSTGSGSCLAGFGVLTGVVDGPVSGSANAGVIPPVSAVNEIAVPVANTTINPRPRQVELIGS